MAKVMALNGMSLDGNPFGVGSTLKGEPSQSPMLALMGDGGQNLEKLHGALQVFAVGVDAIGLARGIVRKNPRDLLTAAVGLSENFVGAAADHAADIGLDEVQEDLMSNKVVFSPRMG